MIFILPTFPYHYFTYLSISLFTYLSISLFTYLSISSFYLPFHIFNLHTFPYLHFTYLSISSFYLPFHIFILPTFPYLRFSYFSPDQSSLKPLTGYDYNGLTTKMFKNYHFFRQQVLLPGVETIPVKSFRFEPVDNRLNL